MAQETSCRMRQQMAQMVGFAHCEDEQRKYLWRLFSEAAGVSDDDLPSVQLRVSVVIASLTLPMVRNPDEWRQTMSATFHKAEADIAAGVRLDTQDYVVRHVNMLVFNACCQTFPDGVVPDTDRAEIIKDLSKAVTGFLLPCMGLLA